MMYSFLRPIAALTLLLALSACGGKATFAVGGTVNGLNYEGLVLANGTDTLTVHPLAKDGSAPVVNFTMPSQIGYGTPYNVTVQSMPQHESCTVFGGNDSAGRLASITVQVVCSQLTHTLGGTITGYTATNTPLTLINGSAGGSISISSGATDFTFPSGVPELASYGVTIFQQPDTSTCTLSHGTGFMNDANLANIVVTCVPNPPATTTGT